MITHELSMSTAEALFILSRKYEGVRYWFCTYGHLVGVWTAKNGKEYAIGQDQRGVTIAYRTSK